MYFLNILINFFTGKILFFVRILSFFDWINFYKESLLIEFQFCKELFWLEINFFKELFLIELKFSKELFWLEKNILGIFLYIFTVIFRGISYIFEKLIVIHIKIINFVKDYFVWIIFLCKVLEFCLFFRR